MIRGTTPTFILTLSGVDLDLCHSIHITLRQKEKIIDITEFERDGNQLSVWLNQEQSLKLNKSSKLELQVNGLTSANHRWATKIVTLEIFDQLLNGVIV